MRSREDDLQKQQQAELEGRKAEKLQAVLAELWAGYTAEEKSRVRQQVADPEEQARQREERQEQQEWQEQLERAARQAELVRKKYRTRCPIPIPADEDTGKGGAG